MSADVLYQSADLPRHADCEIVVAMDVDPSAFALKAVVAESPTATPIITLLTADLAVSTTTVTIPLTPTQTGTTLSAATYYVALWRTDDGSTEPLAAGTINLFTFPWPR